MLTKSGVKLLDFGLAKAPGRAGRVEATACPDDARDLTRGGRSSARSIHVAGAARGEKGRRALGHLRLRRDALRDGDGQEGVRGAQSGVPDLGDPELAAAAVRPFGRWLRPLDGLVRRCLARDPEEVAVRGGPEAALAGSPRGAQAGAPAPLPAGARAESAGLGDRPVALAASLLSGLSAIPRRSGGGAPASGDAPLERPEGPVRVLRPRGLLPDGASSRSSRTIRRKALALDPAAGLARGRATRGHGRTSRNSSGRRTAAPSGFFAEGKLKRVAVSGGPPQVSAEAPWPRRRFVERR